MWAKPQTSVAPYRGLNSWKREPSTMRAMTSNMFMGTAGSSGTRPSSSSASNMGISGAAMPTSVSLGLLPARCSRMARTLTRPSASVSARWSTTPETVVCMMPPPSSCSSASSPVAAFTRGGPPRYTVPLFLTITLSSHIAGMYAAPAVHMPQMRATCGIRFDDMTAWFLKAAPPITKDTVGTPSEDVAVFWPSPVFASSFAPPPSTK
mmetsp:Transcript_19135/g.55563  ORF Transcript_19135/g.55563 Transcript_19135/m.55563 type:complete len:208 (+) Transcript_19135:695-1318(+)